MIICKYFVLFIVYSFFGWIYETIYSSIVHHQFESRGFLYGPIIPIYGFGAVIASIIFFELPIPALKHVTNLGIFTICFIGSIFLEYFTSWLLEKVFHARWWDYSHSFLNINGRICFFASCGFGVAGIILKNGLLAWMKDFTTHVNPLLMEIVALLFMLLLGMDLAVTISSLTNFEKNLKQISERFTSKMSSAYDSIEKNLSEKKVAIVASGTEFLEEHERIAKAVDKMGDAKEAITETISEKKEAITETLSEKKDAHTDADYFDKEVDKYIKSTTWLQKRALRNIKYTTYEGQEKDISDRALFRIKNKKTK